MKNFRLILLALIFAPMVALAADDLPVDQFLAQVIELIKGFGGMSWVAKISGIVLLIIATMKVSFLAPFWNKLGAFKVWLAPILGLVAGVLSLQPVTFAGVMAYVSAGAGAIILHELLDSVKAIPGLGSLWVSLIGIVEGALKKPEQIQ